MLLKMNRRPRRKSTAPAAKKPIVESSSDTESISVSSSDHDEKKNKKRKNKSKKVHMTKDQDEDFIKLCIEHFDEINSMSTMRGAPSSRQGIVNLKHIQTIWESIANTMNESMKVSKFFTHLYGCLLKSVTVFKFANKIFF